MQRRSHPDNAGGLQHHPGPLHACHLPPFQVGSAGALDGLVHLLSPAGHHLTQDAACGNNRGQWVTGWPSSKTENTRCEELWSSLYYSHLCHNRCNRKTFFFFPDFPIFITYIKFLNPPKNKRGGSFSYITARPHGEPRCERASNRSNYLEQHRYNKH